MKKSIINICVKLSGKTQKQLASDYTFAYFFTRSKVKSYWFALFK